jgi:hypothetical protein
MSSALKAGLQGLLPWRPLQRNAVNKFSPCAVRGYRQRYLPAEADEGANFGAETARRYGNHNEPSVHKTEP